MPSRLRPAVLTGLKGAARNPTALTALRPTGSCNSAVSVYPVSCSLHCAKAAGVPFLIFQCAISRGDAPLFRQGVSQTHIAPLQKQERPVSVRQAEHLQALPADVLLSAVLFRAG